MGDKDGAQQVFALNKADGKIVWSAKLGPPWDDEYAGPRGTPTVDGDLVYAIGTEGDLVCLEAATGKERWRKSLPRDFGGSMSSMWKFSESPLVDGDRLVFTPGAQRRRPGRGGQEDGPDDLEGRRPRPRAAGQGRRRLLRRSSSRTARA